MLLTAQKIHDGRQWLPEDTIIETDDNGTILNLYQSRNKDGVTVYDGILMPGFVNVHCHLELSHMKGVVPEHTGLIPFLQQIPRHRNNFTEEQKLAARHAAYNELVSNGIVAVGDIANTTDTSDLRAMGKMHIHTFVEAIGFNQSPERNYGFATQTYDAFAAQQGNGKLLRQSIVPHAPYSVSETFFGVIDQHQEDAIISIHNQECWGENQFYINKEGPVRELLGGLGIDYSFFRPSGRASLPTYLEWLSQTHPVVFIHNTYTTLEDIRYAHNNMPDTFWCFCPNANLYIEETLPQIDLFVQERANICIGTDSLASNHQLSILSELLTIKEHFPNLSWEVLLQWGTLNGAMALQMNSLIGSLEAGKQPGIMHLSNTEPGRNTVIKRIV